MNPSFKIGDRTIGYDYAPLVIAEIGINHEGNLKTAYEMVDAAHEAGAEVIKHQTHVVEDEMSEEAKLVIPGNADMSIYDIMARCALDEEDETKLKNYVENKGMLFLSTPFSREAAFRLERMGIKAYKIGSGECNNYPLVKLIASFGKPIILSTGMNTLKSIQKSVNIIREAGVPFALLHCTNIYPTPYESVRLGAMTELANRFPDAVIGLSDHTTDNFACLGAVALGASILERHFTDTMHRHGPDIVCSMDPNGLQELQRGAKALKLARGGTKNAVIAGEKPTKAFAFASVVADKNIEAGDVFSEENIWVKRPASGDYSADDYEYLLGKIAKKAIKKGQQISKDAVGF